MYREPRKGDVVRVVAVHAVVPKQRPEFVAAAAAERERDPTTMPIPALLLLRNGVRPPAAHVEGRIHRARNDVQAPRCKSLQYLYPPPLR